MSSFECQHARNSSRCKTTMTTFWSMISATKSNKKKWTVSQPKPTISTSSSWTIRNSCWRCSHVCARAETKMKLRLIRRYRLLSKWSRLTWMSHSAFLWTSLSKDHLMKKGRRPTTESIKYSSDKPLERKLRSYTRMKLTCRIRSNIAIGLSREEANFASTGTTLSWRLPFTTVSGLP